MKCSVCGYENNEDSKVCAGCNAAIDASDKQNKFEKYKGQDGLFVGRSEISETNVMRNIFRKMASSTVLISAVLFQTVSLVFSGLIYVAVLNRVERYLIATDILNINSPKTYELVGNIGLWILLLPGLFTVMGMWISIFSALSKSRRVTPVGIHMIRISKSLEMVNVIAVICAFIVAQMVEGGASVITVIIVLINLALMGLVILCYNGTFVSIRNVLFSIFNEEPSDSMARATFVSGVVISLLSLALGVISLVLFKNIVLCLWGLSFGVAKGLFVIFILKYNDTMDWIYHSSWEEFN